MSEETQVFHKKILESDVRFNEIFPIKIRMLANRHWTPVHITRLAVDFLAGEGSKVLDIGSGVGKFCLAGGCYAPGVSFTGIEQRGNFVEFALEAQKMLDIQNVSFIHGNFTQLNLRDFDHFYFYNSFFENIDEQGRIDDEIECSDALYEYYARYLSKELQQMPAGTKIATYHTFHGEIPGGYELVDSLHNGDLNFWIKKHN